MKLITLKSSDIKKNIASMLIAKLSRDGFIYKKSNNSFVKSENGFEFIVYLLIRSRSDHYAIEVFLFIRQKQVEKLLNKIVGESTNITIGNTIGIIFNSPDGRREIRNLMEILLIEDNDIEAAAETIEQQFESIAKPYLEKYNNLESINDLINNPPFEHTPAHVGGMFDDRCMRGLIINRLLKKEDFMELVAFYDKAIMVTMNEKSIGEYEKVRDYLMYNEI